MKANVTFFLSNIITRQPFSDKNLVLTCDFTFSNYFLLNTPGDEVSFEQVSQFGDKSVVLTCDVTYNNYFLLTIPVYDVIYI